MSVKISASFYDKLDSTKVGTAIDAACRELSEALYSKCVQNSPYRTGKLQESHAVRGRTSTAELKTEAEIINRAKYWSYVEFGTSKMSARRWAYNSLREVDAPRTFYRSFKAHYKVKD